MKKYALGLLMLLFAAVFCACGPAEPSNKQVKIDIQMEEEKQQYTLEDGKTPALDFSVQKPVVTIEGNETAAKAINDDSEALYTALVNGGTEGSGVSGRDEMIDYAQEDFNMRQEGDFGGDFFGYSLYREVASKRQDAAVISLVYQDYYYMGGAHGNTVCSGKNYDTQTGERLTLEDITAENADLQSFCTQKILELSLGDDYKYEGESIFFEDYAENVPSIVNDGLWYFSEEGLTFISNQYVLAPYAAGVIEFTIPYADLQGIVKDAYLL